jgi:hypothetical protein
MNAEAKMGRIKWITKDDGEREPTYVSDWHDKETEQYQEEHKKKVSDEDAEFIVKKIARHFKLGDYSIRFHGNRDSGHIWYGGFNKEVCLSHNPSFALICHEFVHPLCHKRYKRQIAHGCKKWKYQLSRIVDYCKKKGFWEQELKDREQREMQRQHKYIEDSRKQQETTKVMDAFKGLEKLKPTKEEKKKQKIAEIEQKIKGFQRRTKLYQTKIKKLQKKLKRML